MIRTKFTSWCVVVLTFTALLLGSGRAQAQGLGFGVKGGLVYPNFSLDPDTLDIHNRIGWEAGAFFGGDRTGFFGLQTEINYQELRSAVDLPAGGRGHVTLGYVQIPVLARLNLGTESKNIFAVYFMVGPSFDFKVSEKFTDINPPPPSDSFETFDMGLMFAGGVEITRLIIEGRYEVGLSQLNKNFQQTSDLKVNTWALLFGLRFN